MSQLTARLTFITGSIANHVKALKSDLVAQQGKDAPADEQQATALLADLEALLIKFPVQPSPQS